MGSTVILPSKITSASVFLEVDASHVLNTGETVTSAACSATVYSGVDANPSAVISGGATVAQNVVSQLVTGGEAGVIYLIRFTLQTNQSNVYILLGKLAVLS